MTDPCMVDWCDRPVGDGYGMPVLSRKRGTIDGAERCVNTPRPLTHSLDLSKEGLAMKATCSVGGCGKPVKTSKSGLCGMHLSRLARTGTTEPRTYDMQAAIARFWSKVEVRGEGECWPYTGTILGNGYGQFRVQCKGRLAHRFAYEVSVGPIPDGMTLDHVKARGCTLLNCVNPAHLEPVTMLENLRRSTSVGAMNSRKTECPRCGGAYATDAKGQRYCRPCRIAWKTRRAS